MNACGLSGAQVTKLQTTKLHKLPEAGLGRCKPVHYVPDIGRLGALCDGNFQKLKRLLDSRPDAAVTALSLYNGDAYLGKIRIERLQQSRYTDTYYLEQIHNAGRWLNNPQMTVRAYQDAESAEVISCYRYRRIEAFSDYPNRYMHHPDEKVQVNAFLAEWLSFCLRYGAVEDTVFIPCRRA